MQPESYVVRLYRRTKADPAEIVGVVEWPATGRQAAFRGLAELCAILAAPHRHLRRYGASPKPIVGPRGPREP
ncbi:hypothetical protein [Burkholderia sp. PU8-34]